MSTSTILQIRDNGQITLPTSVRRKTNLKTGDLLEVNIEEDGSIRLTPQVTMDRAQAYFWSKRWQEGEKEAEQDIHDGKVKEFNALENLIDDLESEK